MQDLNAARILTAVMGWRDLSTIQEYVKKLQLLADYKYDHYQRFAPGRRFIESLALWLERLDETDRAAAFELVTQHLIYFSDAEFSHLVQTAYPDLIVQERMRLVAEEHNIPTYRVGQLARHRRFEELKLKSLYLGLSDGAHTNELRRASNGEISNEQIWQAYELGEQKSEDMLQELRTSTSGRGFSAADPRFNLIWLLDDFSGSGNTYIRYDGAKKTYKGKLKRVYDQLHSERLVDPSYYEVFLLLYVATSQAIDHIEYWCERFTAEMGYKPLQIRVLCPLERDIALTKISSATIAQLLAKERYFDSRVAKDKHIAVGGTDGRLGFAGCALPVVLSHNTPNNSIYLLWGYEQYQFSGLFPRVTRHREP
ncbi:hypothetical protein [Hyphomicrobium sp.]|uniref:phosphoribosyltransferase-like protein n=1 Tax=Hyphomicrobium sp. TaxID=82 RepID=UPI0025C04AF6|nr:hypothetical protein [Hyphomicrobium sp.]MCC7253630.1 hypothetical protein [Hyphomicrobium sp.]